MSQNPKNIYQFKITLEGSSPPIWRRIQVPETYSFWDLHVAIQDAMGWYDCHLHAFVFPDPNAPKKGFGGGPIFIGIPDAEGIGTFETRAGWEEKIASHFSLERPKANYDYDFGDNWEHTITLEKIIPLEEGVKYPMCLEGKRACPPEDCGGVWGYENLLEVLADPKHEDHESLLEWAGGPIDPEKFDPKKVRFSDPKKRFKQFFG